MSDSNCECFDPMMQVDNVAESHHQEFDENVYLCGNISTDYDGWLRERLSRAESQLQYEDYPSLKQQTFTDSIPPPASWTSAGTNETFPSGHKILDQLEQSADLSTLASQTNYRDFWWTSWPEHHSPAAGQPGILEAQAQSDQLLRHSADESSLVHTASQDWIRAHACRQIPPEDNTFNITAISSPNRGHFAQRHIHEPVPSISTRSSLLADWIEQPRQDQEIFTDANQPDGYSNWITIDAATKQQASPSFFVIACESPLDTLSLPDLSCPRRQSPGSGSTDAISIGRPATPLDSGLKLTNTACTCSEHHSAASPRQSSYCSFTSGSSNSAAISRSPMFSHADQAESQCDVEGNNRAQSVQSEYRYSFNIFPAISIPSPPQLFASALTTRASSIVIAPSATKNPPLLPPITDEDLKAPVKEAGDCQSTDASALNSSRSKSERTKRKRMHICATCGKDFNRPSALLLHRTVHTGERSNFCKVCGKSFSNLSNLRRHQRQLHVFESQMPLPAIPGPTSALDAYNFGSQTRF